MYSPYYCVPDFQFIANLAGGHRQLIQNNYHKLINILNLRSLLSNGLCRFVPVYSEFRNALMFHRSVHLTRDPRAPEHTHPNTLHVCCTSSILNFTICSLVTRPVIFDNITLSGSPRKVTN